MAERKEDTSLDDVDFDDLSFDDFDVGEDPDTPTDRSPLGHVKTGLISGVTSAFTSEEDIKTLAKNALPKSYETVFNAVDSARSGIDDIYEAAAKELKPAMPFIRKTVSKSIPKVESFLPKAMVDKLKEFVEEGNYDGPRSQQQIDQEEIQNSIGNIFKTQMEAQAAMQAEERAESRIQQHANQKQLEGHGALLSKIERHTQRLASYQDDITLKYQQKSLELQYRSFFALRDQLKLAEVSSQSNKALLEAIVKNTSLPEVQKIKNTERVGEMMRDRFLGKVGNTAAKYSEQLFSNFQKAIKEKVVDAAGTLSMMLDSAQSASDSDLTLGQTLEMLVSGWVQGRVQKAGGILARKLRPKLMKAFPELAEDGNRLEYLIQNPEELARYIKSMEVDSSEHGFIADAKRNALASIKELLPSFSPESSIKRNGYESLEDATNFDRHTHRSITEIIPGYLSYIHRELVGIRTGQLPDPKERLVYDHDKQSFSSYGSALKSITRRIMPVSETELTQRRANELMSDIGLDAGKHPELAARVREQLIADARNGYGTGFNPEYWGSSNISRVKLLSPEEQALIGEMVDARFTRLNKKGERVTNYTAFGEHARLAKEMQRSQFNGHSSIQGLVNLGYGEYLHDLGLYKDGDITRLDLDRLAHLEANMRMDSVESRAFNRKMAKVRERLEKKKAKNAKLRASFGGLGQYLFDEDDDLHSGLFKGTIDNVVEQNKATASDLNQLRDDFKRKKVIMNARDSHVVLNEDGEYVVDDSIERAVEIINSDMSPQEKRDALVGIADEKSEEVKATIDKLKSIIQEDPTYQKVKSKATSIKQRVENSVVGEKLKETQQRFDPYYKQSKRSMRKAHRRAKAEMEKARRAGLAHYEENYLDENGELKSLDALGKQALKDTNRLIDLAKQKHSEMDYRGMVENQYANVKDRLSNEKDAFKEKHKEEIDRITSFVDEKKAELTSKYVTLKERLTLKYQDIKSKAQSHMTTAKEKLQPHMDEAKAKFLSVKDQTNRFFDPMEKESTQDKYNRHEDLFQLALERNELLKEIINGSRMTVMALAESSGGQVNPDTLVGRLKQWAGQGWSTTSGLLEKGWDASKFIASLPFKAARTYFQTVWNGTKFAGRKLKDLFDWTTSPGDVYSKKTGQILLYAKKMRAGHYADQQTGEPVKRYSDIRGAVIDITQNNEVVLTEEEFNEDAYDTKGRALRRSIGKGIRGITEYGFQAMGLYGQALAVPFKVARWGLRKVTDAMKEKEPHDVYVLGDDPWQPRLRGVLIRAGAYRFRKTNKPLTTHLDANKDEIINDKGDIIISYEDIDRGLVDYRGKPFKSMTRKLMDAGKWALNWGVRAAKGYADLVWGAVGALKNIGLGMLGVPGMFRRDTTYWKTHSERLMDVLVSIHDMLDLRLPGKPHRKGSWQEQLAEKAKAAKEKVLEKKETLSNKTFMSTLVSGFKTAMGRLFGKDEDGDGTPDAFDKDADGDGENDDEGDGEGNTYVLGGDSADQKKGRRNRRNRRGGKRRRGRGKSGGRGGSQRAQRNAGKPNTSIGRAAGAARGATAGKLGILGRAKGLLNWKSAALMALGSQVLGDKLPEGVGTAVDAISTGLMVKSALGMLGTGGAATAASGGLATTAAAGTATGGAVTSLGALGGGAALTVGLPVVLAAAAIGGAAYVGFSHFKYGGYQPYRDFRMAQYGVDGKEKDHVEAILSLEGHIKDTGAFDGTTIDGNKLDVKAILEMFDQENSWFWGGGSDDSRNEFNQWFIHRFSAVYATHEKLRREYGIEDIALMDDQLKPEDAKQYLTKAKQGVNPEVYQVLARPFPEQETIPNADVVEQMYQRAMHEADLKSKGKKTSRGGQTFAAAVGKISGQTSFILEQVGFNKFVRNNETIQSSYRNAPGWIQDMARNMGLMTDESAKSMDEIRVRLEETKRINRDPTTLEQIRYKTYGLVELTKTKVDALRLLEQFVIDSIAFTGDELIHDKSWKDYWKEAHVWFALNEASDAHQERFQDWFEQRFLPVVLAFVKAVRVENRRVKISDVEKELTGEQLVRIANAFMGAKYERLLWFNRSVWEYIQSPWTDQVPLNALMGSCDPLLKALQNQVSKEDSPVYRETEPGKSPSTAINPQAVFKSMGNGNNSNAMVGGHAATDWMSALTGQGATGRVEYTTGTLNVTRGTGGVYSQLPDVGVTRTEAQVAPLIKAVAEQTGMDYGAMMRVIARESSFQSDIRNPRGSATGLFQFINDTWDHHMTAYGKQFGIPAGTRPTDARANALLGAQYMLDNYRALSEAKNGEPVTEGEIYAAHFLGTAGAKRVLKLSHSTPIRSAFSEAVLNANPHMKNMATMADFWNWVNKKAGGQRSVSIDTTPKPTIQSGSNTPDWMLLPEKQKTQTPASNWQAGNGSLLMAPTAQPQPASESKDNLGGVAYHPLDNSGMAPVKPNDFVDPVVGQEYAILGNNVRIDGLNPAMRQSLMGAIGEYGQQTGKKVTITSGYRSTEDQERLYRKYGPGRAAVPGKSTHEFGLAVDINSPDANAMDRMGLFKKYGLTRPISGEPWHVEPVGIQGRIAEAKTNATVAAGMIQAGFGQGGGGWGANDGGPRKYARGGTPTIGWNGESSMLATTTPAILGSPIPFLEQAKATYVPEMTQANPLGGFTAVNQQTVVKPTVPESEPVIQTPIPETVQPKHDEVMLTQNESKETARMDAEMAKVNETLTQQLSIQTEIRDLLRSVIDKFKDRDISAVSDVPVVAETPTPAPEPKPTAAPTKVLGDGVVKTGVSFARPFHV